jgi:hypothetical protein
MLEKRLDKLDTMTGELEEIVGQIQSNQGSLYEYQFKVIDRQEAAYNRMRKAGQARINYSKDVETLDNALKADNDFLTRLKLERARIKADIKYKLSTMEWAKNSYEVKVREKIKDSLSNYADFIHTVHIGASLSLKNARLFNEYYSEIKAFVDDFPKAILKGQQLLNSQVELSESVRKHKSACNNLYRYSVQALAKRVGHSKARQLIGNARGLRAYAI